MGKKKTKKIEVFTIYIVFELFNIGGGTPPATPQDGSVFNYKILQFIAKKIKITSAYICISHLNKTHGNKY